jgi:hypothetical protein
MTEPPAPLQPSPGGIAGIISQILGYIDSPWKAAVVILLFIIGGTGWVLYENREAIIESWLTPDQVVLKTHEIPQALSHLVEQTGADLVQIWSIDLGSNSQKFIAARRRDGERPVIPNPRRLPVIVTTSDMRKLVQVLEGSPVCVDLSEEKGPLSRRLFERNMRRGCAVPIPPHHTAFVGVIYLAWAQPPEEIAEQAAVGTAREIAAKLATQ